MGERKSRRGKEREGGGEEEGGKVEARSQGRGTWRIQGHVGVNIIQQHFNFLIVPLDIRTKFLRRQDSPDRPAPILPGPRTACERGVTAMAALALLPLPLQQKARVHFAHLAAPEIGIGFGNQARRVCPTSYRPGAGEADSTMEVEGEMRKWRWRENACVWVEQECLRPPWSLLLLDIVVG